MNPTDHPTDLTLLRLADADDVHDTTLAAAREHLEHCAACRARVHRDAALFTDARNQRSALLATDALWARIQLTRASGIPVILPDADDALRSAARAPTADTPTDRGAIDRPRNDMAYRDSSADATRAFVGGSSPRNGWTFAMAIAASLMVVAFGTWRVAQTEADTSSRRLTGGIDSATGATRASSAPARRESSAPSAEQSLLQTLSPWPTMAYAQTPGGGRAAPGRPAPYPPISGLDARRLKEGRRWYLRSSANDYHDMLPHLLTSVETARVKWKQKAAWRLVTREPMRDNAVSVDTLIVLDSTLQPVFRRTHVGFMEVREEFADSAVTETFIMRPPPELMADLKSSKTGRSMAANMRAQKPMVTTHRIDRRRITPLGDHSMRLLLQAAPLTATWKGSVDVFVRMLNTQTTLRPSPDANYLNLRVDGIDTVQVFNGRIEVWRVLLETGPKPEVWYVSRETGETVLTEGAWGPSYPDSKNLLMGWHETKRLPPVRIR